MQMVISHLTYLLTKHECVVVPGLGAFVVNQVPASFDPVGGVFIAPCRNLGFNPEIRHNDGLLSNSIMKDQSISYQEANLLIGKFVEDLSQRMHLTRLCEIPGLGKLTVTAENKLCFSPAHSLPCNVNYYGLNNFYLPSLNSVEKVVTDDSENLSVKTKEIIWIPVRKRFVRSLSLAAACVLAFILFSTPIQYEDVSSHYAAVLFPTVKDFSDKAELFQEEVSASEFLKVKSGLSLSQESQESQEQAQDSSLTKTKEIAAVQTELTPDPIQSLRYYYIVVASLPSRKSADETLQLPPFAALKDAAILEKDSKYRIYVRRFSDKSEAETFLIKFRNENPKHINAWLLSDRSNS